MFFLQTKYYSDEHIQCTCKVNLSRYTTLRHMGGEEVQLLLILNLGTR
jgi:hypothetical protein